MKSLKKTLLYGFLIWLIPFIVAFLIFPIRESNRPLFESIMPIAVTACAVVFSILYFKKLETEFLKEGILIGAVWFLISLIIDLMMFLPESPMHMDFIPYMMDIGLTYMIIPIITIGFGYLAMRSS